MKFIGRKTKRNTRFLGKHLIFGLSEFNKYLIYMNCYYDKIVRKAIKNTDLIISVNYWEEEKLPFTMNLSEPRNKRYSIKTR